MEDHNGSQQQSMKFEGEIKSYMGGPGVVQLVAYVGQIIKRENKRNNGKYFLRRFDLVSRQLPNPGCLYTSEHRGVGGVSTITWGILQTCSKNGLQVFNLRSSFPICKTPQGTNTYNHDVTYTYAQMKQYRPETVATHTNKKKKFQW